MADKPEDLEAYDPLGTNVLKNLGARMLAAHADDGGFTAVINFNKGEWLALVAFAFKADPRSPFIGGE